ncbi:hypothetical protein MNBD_ALPHA05-2050, partial [hydrothermal vent metagenome]
MRMNVGFGLRAGLASLMAAAIVACETAPVRPGTSVVTLPGQPGVEAPPSATPLGPEFGQEARRYDRRGYTRPRHMEGKEPVRVGLLLPFSANSAPA